MNHIIRWLRPNYFKPIQRFPIQTRLTSQDSGAKDGSDTSKKKVATLKDDSKKKSTKIESLSKKAENIKSVGPNDQDTINRVTAKPKIHVRQSAREPEKQRIVENDSEPIDVISRGLDKRLVEAARRVAGRMPKHLASQTEKKLLDSIQKQTQESKEAKKKFVERKEDITQSISYKILSKRKRAPVMIDEPIDDQIPGSSVTRIKLPPRSTNEPGVPGTRHRRDTNLFTGECLGIFDPKGVYLTDALNRNTLWKELSTREYRISSQPENAFEEQIRWTEEGKLWRFPIDNEQGLEQEAQVPFYDHVMLDDLLEGFPGRGPVRDFMELVIMGLSQNPYVTVPRKREMVAFYKNFFEENNLLVEVNEAQ